MEYDIKLKARLIIVCSGGYFLNVDFDLKIMFRGPFFVSNVIRVQMTFLF